VIAIGDRVREARTAAGFESGAKFARAMGVGTEEVWRIETGRRNPGLATIKKIAELTNVSIDWLVYGDEGESDSTPPTPPGSESAA
jgi:transcriptional regulator with XRE-family HTH domain